MMRMESFFLIDRLFSEVRWKQMNKVESVQNAAMIIFIFSIILSRIQTARQHTKSKNPRSLYST